MLCFSTHVGDGVLIRIEDSTARIYVGRRDDADEVLEDVEICLRSSDQSYLILIRIGRRRGGKGDLRACVISLDVEEENCQLGGCGNIGGQTYAELSRGCEIFGKYGPKENS